MLPARLLLDVVRALPADDVTLELRAAEQDVELRSGAATFHIRTLRAEDFPPLPEPGGDTEVTVPAEAFVTTIARVAALGLARRDAPGADRHPRHRRGAAAADGRDRLLPAVGQGDPARVAAVGLVRGQRAGSRAAASSAGSSRAATSTRCTIGVRQNQIVFQVGRHRALLAADRGAVPQLPPAAARRLRARAHARARPSSSRSCGASRCWPRRTCRCGWPSRPAS